MERGCRTTLLFKPAWMRRYKPRRWPLRRSFWGSFKNLLSSGLKVRGQSCRRAPRSSGPAFAAALLFDRKGVAWGFKQGASAARLRPFAGFSSGATVWAMFTRLFTRTFFTCPESSRTCHLPREESKESSVPSWPLRSTKASRPTKRTRVCSASFPVLPLAASDSAASDAAEVTASAFFFGGLLEVASSVRARLQSRIRRFNYVNNVSARITEASGSCTAGGRMKEKCAEVVAG